MDKNQTVTKNDLPKRVVAAIRNCLLYYYEEVNFGERGPFTRYTPSVVVSLVSEFLSGEALPWDDVTACATVLTSFDYQEDKPEAAGPGTNEAWYNAEIIENWLNGMLVTCREQS